MNSHFDPLNFQGRPTSSVFAEAKTGRAQTIRTNFGLSALPLAVLAAVSLLPRSSQAELIPANRLADWTAGVSVGVPGGIPTNRTNLINVTLSPYNADKTGAANAAPAIQAAVNSAVPGDVVYLPTGTYRLESMINIGAHKDGITIRGDGMDSTIIASRVQTAFTVGSGSDYEWRSPSTGNDIIAGLVRGSREITISDTSPFVVGQIVQIAVENQTDNAAIQAGATPIVSVSGWTYLRRQLTRVVGKTSTKLQVFPAVHYTVDPGLKARVNHVQQQSEYVGIEDLTIDGTNAQMNFPIYFQQCYASWIKGVKVTKTANYGLYLSDSLNCEVRQCFISERKTGGSNGAGVLMGHVGNSLIEDNIIIGIFPAVEVNFSSTGNVVAYNLLENSIGGTLNTNHGPHNSFNLYEGNVSPNMQSDGYFGSASDDTFFRNWFHGTDRTLNLRTFFTSLNRFTRNYNLVGNILGEQGTSGTTPYSFGNPNMGNSQFAGQAKPTNGVFWSDWKATATLSSRNSDTSGTIQLNSGSVFVGQWLYVRWGSDSNLHQVYSVGSVSGKSFTWTNGGGSPLPAQGTSLTIHFLPSGYQEQDLDVEATTLLKANYFYPTRKIPDNESIGADTLPDSLFRASKPDWFGTLAWPPFNPFSPAPTFTSIPAGFRYINSGMQPPSGVATAPSNVKIRRQ
jgi:hypothetical protein